MKKMWKEPEIEELNISKTKNQNIGEDSSMIGNQNVDTNNAFQFPSGETL